MAVGAARQRELRRVSYRQRVPDLCFQAKLNGARQLFQVVTNTYRTPVPTPVHNLAQGHLTCGECHSNLDLDDEMVEWTEYAPDEFNTPCPDGAAASNRRRRRS